MGVSTNNNRNRNDNNDLYGTSTSRSRSNLNEQWVMNLEEQERDRWLETIRCDSKRMKQCLTDMKNHKFSDAYLPPSSQDDKKENDK